MTLTDALLLALAVELALVILIMLAKHKRHKAHSASVVFLDSQGKELTTMEVGQTAQATLHEWTSTTPGSGVEVPPVGPVSWSSDNLSVATVDASSGLVTAVSAGTVNITGSDAGNGLSASAGESVTAATAKSASVTITVNP